MENSYLIPANSKKSMLVFGLFTRVEFWGMLVPSVVISFILMTVLPIGNFLLAILAISPALIVSFLLIPIPNYHNIKTVIKNAWEFYTTRQKYIWKGWCFGDGERDKK